MMEAAQTKVKKTIELIRFQTRSTTLLDKLFKKKKKEKKKVVN